MQVVTPVAIDTGRLVASNVPAETGIYDPDREYSAGATCIHGQRLYQAAVGIDTSQIPVHDPLKEYLTGDKVKVPGDQAVYGAISGRPANDFDHWAADRLFVAGNYTAILATKRIYIARAGENPADFDEWATHALTLTGVAGTFVVGETVAGGSGSGVVAAVVGAVLRLTGVVGSFFGEGDAPALVTGATSGATGMSSTLAPVVYGVGDFVRVTPVYDIRQGNVLNQTRIYQSLRAENIGRPPAGNLTGSNPYWKLSGICNLNAPPDTSVLYQEHDPEENCLAGYVRKVTDAGAAFIALRDNVNCPPPSNLVGSDPAWKLLEKFDCNRTDANYLWSEFDRLNIGITPSEDAALKTPTAWKKIGVCNVKFQPDENIYVAATSSSDAVGAWYDLKAANQWKMFDDSVSSQTSNPEKIEVDLLYYGCDTIALFNLVAYSVDLKLFIGEQVIYEETISTFLDNYTSWYDIFFKAPEYRSSIYRRLPSAYGATLRVTINAPYGTAKCGHLVIGPCRELGTTENGVSIKSNDFSLTETDKNGDTYLAKGKFTRSPEFDIRVPSAEMYIVLQFLEERRATPLVFNISNSDVPFSPMDVIYGYCSKHVPTLKSFNDEICNLVLQGLT